MLAGKTGEASGLVVSYGYRAVTGQALADILGRHIVMKNHWCRRPVLDVERVVSDQTSGFNTRGFVDIYLRREAEGFFMLAILTYFDKSNVIRVTKVVGSDNVLSSFL
jgi:hypothetical protein